MLPQDAPAAGVTDADAEVLEVLGERLPLVSEALRYNGVVDPGRAAAVWPAVSAMEKARQLEDTGAARRAVLHAADVAPACAVAARGALSGLLEHLLRSAQLTSPGLDGACRLALSRAFVERDDLTQADPAEDPLQWLWRMRNGLLQPRTRLPPLPKPLGQWSGALDRAVRKAHRRLHHLADGSTHPHSALNPYYGKYAVEWADALDAFVEHEAGPTLAPVAGGYRLEVLERYPDRVDEALQLGRSLASTGSTWLWERGALVLMKYKRHEDALALIEELLESDDVEARFRDDLEKRQARLLKPGKSAGGTMDADDQAALQALTVGLSRTTEGAYAGLVRRFKLWHSQNAGVSWPAAMETLGGFQQVLLEQGQRPETAANYTRTIERFLLIRAGANPLAPTRVSRVELSQPPTQQAGIEPEDSAAPQTAAGEALETATTTSDSSSSRPKPVRRLDLDVPAELSDAELQVVAAFTSHIPAASAEGYAAHIRTLKNWCLSGASPWPPNRETDLMKYEADLVQSGVPRGAARVAWQTALRFLDGLDEAFATTSAEGSTLQASHEELIFAAFGLVPEEAPSTSDVVHLTVARIMTLLDELSPPDRNAVLKALRD